MQSSITRERNGTGMYRALIRSITLFPRILMSTKCRNWAVKAENIEVLRAFRDEYMLTDRAGEALVQFYYAVSPPVAEFITAHPGLKPIVRAGLAPAVAVSAVIVNTSPADKIVIAGLLVVLVVAMAVWVTRRRHKSSQYA